MEKLNFRDECKCFSNAMAPVSYNSIKIGSSGTSELDHFFIEITPRRIDWPFMEIVKKNYLAQESERNNPKITFLGSKSYS